MSPAFIGRPLSRLASTNVRTSHSELLGLLHRYFENRMASPSPDDLGIRGPPTGVRGMEVLDREAFRLDVLYPALRLETSWMLSLRKLMTTLKLYQRKVDSVIPAEDAKDARWVLLDPGVCPSFEALKARLDPAGRAFFDHFKITEAAFDFRRVSLDYENFSADTILEWTLPEDVGPVKGYTNVGHVVHLNLKEPHLPFKKLIGQVYLDKVPSAKTVVNKTSEIDNVYRNFEYEVLAGEENLVTRVKESQCVFDLDFAKVYWNSRLGTEHARVIDTIPMGSVVYDAFAGIGPFAIPAAKNRRCRVFANDLNPDSFAWLKRNVASNSSKKLDLRTLVDCHELDARAFLRTIVLPDVARRWKSGKPEETFVLMNLPGMAIEFLDVFPGGLNGHVDEAETSSFGMERALTVFCYSFSKAEDVEKDTLERVESVLGTSLPETDRSIRSIRNVAPKKWYMVTRIRLSTDVLLSREPPLKKIKLDSGDS